MFIKKYEKDTKTYYVLTIINSNEKDTKKKFISCFIDEEIATGFIALGVPLKEKNNEE